jgi:acetyl-CoA carboxylase biotin carboxyl carrier protein
MRDTYHALRGATMVRLPEKNPDERPHAVAAGVGGFVLPTLAELSQEVKELVRHISTTDVNELHLESGPIRIVIKRGVASSTAHSAFHPVSQPQAGLVYTPPPTLAAPPSSSVVNMIGQSPSHGEGVLLTEGEQLIVAPIVGTFYAAPSPGEDPYVSEGDSVEPGQIVGIIEAMKMMNEIESEVAGIVVRLLVNNAQPVEYGQPLMVVSANT